MDPPLTTEGQRVREFAEAFCRHTTGPSEGQLIKLRSWQKQIIDDVFTLKPSGLWKYRTALIVLPRKCGKSEMGSIIALYALIASKERGAQLFVAAGSKDQAGNVFEPCKRMVELDADLSEICEVQRNKIICHRNGNVLQVLSSDGKLQHGRNPLVSIVDETHVHPNGELSEALSSGSGARPQSLIIHITTPGAGEGSYLKELCDYGERVATGAVDDPTFYLYWNKPPADCDYTSPDTWAQFHPAYRDWVSDDFLRSQVSQLPEAEFRRLHLAQWTAAKEAWLPFGAWDACYDADADIAPGETVALGVDAAYKRDSTGIVAATPDGRIKVLAHWQAPAGDASWSTDFTEVRDAILNATDTYNVAEIACDPYWLGETIQVLERSGYPVVEFKTNTLALMVPACKRFYDSVIDKRLRHAGDKRLALHLANCRIKSDQYGVRIVKESKDSPNKIDLAVCAVVAYERAAQIQPARQVTYRIF